MTLKSNRTEYSGGIARVFHVTTAGAAIYSELADKYGADNVKQSNSGQGIVDALSMCVSGRGDKIRVWPGTYTPTATITINKTCVTIEGAIPNPAATIIASTTSGVVAFTFAATGDYSTVRNMTILMDVTGPSDCIIVPTSCPGVTLESLIIPNGADTAGLTGIDAESDYLTVENCRIFGVKLAIQSLGINCRFRGNHIVSNLASAVGLDMQDGDNHLVENNVFDLLHVTTTACVKIGTSAKCNQVSFKNNSYNTAAAANITNGNSSTLGQYGDIVSDVTTAVWASV
ncbi:MAG: hypothetical protein WC829_02610 [Hyphomicrobium sp.]|jgi:hypothetical protein